MIIWLSNFICHPWMKQSQTEKLSPKSSRTFFDWSDKIPGKHKFFAKNSRAPSAQQPRICDNRVLRFHLPCDRSCTTLTWPVDYPPWRCTWASTPSRRISSCPPRIRWRLVSKVDLRGQTHVHQSRDFLPARRSLEIFAFFFRVSARGSSNISVKHRGVEKAAGQKFI